MAYMPSGSAHESGSAGTRLRQKVLLGLGLSAVLPVVLLLYLVHAYVQPALDARGPGRAVVDTVVLVTVVAVVSGGWMLWGLGRTVASVVDVIGPDPYRPAGGSRTEDIGLLMANVSRMFETIEQQAAEINGFATRLDAAYRELESSHAKLKETSFKDEVTGIYNRRFFTIRLEEEISRHRRFKHPVSIVLIDLDGFKAVNDEFGHAVGDDTLRTVAATLVTHSRRINVVSRYGGDEFAVLLVETAKDGARVYAERLRDVIAGLAFSHGKSITASLGVAALPDDEVTTIEDLVKMADEALYAAKRAGKNQVGPAEPMEKKLTWNDVTS